jgi:hypothetical protein
MENPKYYRCTNSERANFTIGKIYECLDPDNFQTFNNFMADDGYANGWAFANHNHFTPVTEHEWNLQEEIITPVGKENHSQLSIILKKLHVK